MHRFGETLLRTDGCTHLLGKSKPLFLGGQPIDRHGRVDTPEELVEAQVSGVVDPESVNLNEALSRVSY
jgi:hypothetical protein